MKNTVAQHLIIFSLFLLFHQHTNPNTVKLFKIKILLLVLSLLNISHVDSSVEFKPPEVLKTQSVWADSIWLMLRPVERS